MCHDMDIRIKRFIPISQKADVQGISHGEIGSSRYERSPGLPRSANAPTPTPSTLKGPNPANGVGEGYFMSMRWRTIAQRWRTMTWIPYWNGSANSMSENQGSKALSWVYSSLSPTLMRTDTGCQSNHQRLHRSIQ